MLSGAELHRVCVERSGTSACAFSAVFSRFCYVGIFGNLPDQKFPRTLCFDPCSEFTAFQLPPFRRGHVGDAMQDDYGGPTGLPADPPTTDLLKFRNWVLGPFETLQRQHNYAEMATEWQLEQEEFHVDQGIGDDQLKLFAENAGIKHLEKMTLLQALRAYEIKKGLRVDVAGQCFVPVMDVAAPPAVSTAPGPGGAQRVRLHPRRSPNSFNC